MSLQTNNWGFSPASSSSSLSSSSNDTKKPTQQKTSSIPKIILPVVSSNTNAKPTSPESRKGTDEKVPRIKRMGDNDKQVKSVKELLEKTQQPKLTSIGGSSLPAHLPFYSKSAVFPSHSRDETQRPPRSAENPKTPRSILPPSVFTPLPPALQDVQDAADQLQELTQLFQEQLQLLHQIFEGQGKEAELKVNEKDLVDGAHQMLMGALSEKWATCRAQMDTLLEDECLIEESGFHSISLQSLGLDQQVEFQTGNSKAFIHNAKKSLKGEKHLQLAFKFLTGLMLDCSVNDPLKNKENLKKMLQFIPTKRLEVRDEILSAIAFNYIEQLFLLGELLKQYGTQLYRKVEEEPGYITPLIAHVRKFLGHLEDIKVIKKLEIKDRQEKLDTWCVQLGECILDYAKSLAQHLQPSLQRNGRGQFYESFFTSEVKEKTKERFLSFCDGFAMDFIRSIKGKFLHLSTDKEIVPPQITKNIRQDKNIREFCQFTNDLLQFLMRNLNISEEDLQQYNPLVRLQEIAAESKNTETIMDSLYKEFEKAREEQGGSLTGIFKLLPILRIFNQNNILGIHRALRSLQRGLEIPELSSNAHEPIIAQFTKAESSKTRQAGEILDREEKKTHIEFIQNMVKVTLTRIEALNDLPHGNSRLRPNQFIFPNCLVRSVIALQAPIQDLNTWTANARVEIEYPSSESLNPAFLRRYSLLLTTLEVMGMEYTVTVK